MATKVHPTDALVESIHKMAVRAFENHQLEQRLDVGLHRHWRCGKPDDSAYAFNVTTIPGRIIVTGDLGCLVLERCDDMIPWCRSAINSIDYFAEKVPHEIPTREYDPDVARAWVEDQLADAEECGMAEKTREALADIDDFDNRAATELAIYDSGATDGGDWPTLTNYTPRFLWQREAIKCFLRLLPTPPPAASEEKQE